MSLLVYVDTNIIIDFLEGRNKKSYQFLKETISCKYMLLISNHMLNELEHQGFSSLLFLKGMKRKIKMLSVTKHDMLKAKEYNKYTHYADALHGAIAMNNNADILLTENKKDFLFLSIAKKYDEL